MRRLWYGAIGDDENRFQCTNAATRHEDGVGFLPENLDETAGWLWSVDRATSVVWRLSYCGLLPLHSLPMEFVISASRLSDLRLLRSRSGPSGQYRTTQVYSDLLQPYCVLLFHRLGLTDLAWKDCLFHHEFFVVLDACFCFLSILVF